MNWLTLTLLSQLFIISYYFLSKKTLNQHNSDPRIFGGALQFTTGLIALPFALYNGFSFQLTPTNILLLIALALTYTIGPTLYYIGLKHIDLSETTILDSSGVIWSVILGILLLGENFTPTKILGALCILLAILVVSFKEKSFSIRFSKYELFLLCAPLFYSIGAILDNELVKSSTAISYLSISFLIGGGAMLLSNIHRFQVKGKQTFKQKNFKRTLILNASFVAATYYCIMLAYELGGEVSRIYPIQQLESVIVPLIGIVILKERKHLHQKIIATVIALIGVMLIK